MLQSPHPTPPQKQSVDFEKKVRKYRYNYCNPLLLVFDLIDDLELIGDAAETQYSEKELVLYSLESVRNTGNSVDGIKNWNRRAVAAHTWQYCKPFQASPAGRQPPAPNDAASIYRALL